MKKILNKIAIWLYKKTRDNTMQNPWKILNGIKVFESKFIPKGECYMGTGNDLKEAFLDKEICLK